MKIYFNRPDKNKSNINFNKGGFVSWYVFW